MAKPKIKLTKQRGGYYVVQVDAVSVGYCERSRNFIPGSGYAGWTFRPTRAGVERGLDAKWQTTPKRAVEASLRAKEENDG